MTHLGMNWAPQCANRLMAMSAKERLQTVITTASCAKHHVAMGIQRSFFFLSSKLVYNSDTLYEFERKGREQFEGFRNDQRSFYLPINMNKFQFF